MINQNFIKFDDFEPFITKLLESETLVGPVAHQGKFSFEELEAASDLRLDYDVTILPPKKLFFPPTQELFHFDGQNIKSCIAPRDQVLLGVHFYDIKAIDMLDELFSAPLKDQHYLANREATTIIGSNIQNINERAFYASASSSLQPKGHDGFLTRIAHGYVYETFTPRGEKLLSYGNFFEATNTQIKEALDVNDAINRQSPEKLAYQGQELADRVRAAFSRDEAWEKMAEMCVACGSCNIVCPTCYCFDIQDQWELDQTSCTRCRHWDGCMTNEFAQITLGAGESENFRETVGQRMRHRIMRKTTYLNDRLEDQACVGCGRCSISCVPDIADPVKIIDFILEVEQ